MTMTVAVVMVPVIVIAVMSAALGLERALHRAGRATLTAHQLGHGRAVFHVERLVGDLEEPVLAAKVPGKTHEAQRVLGPNLQKLLGCRLHLHEPPVLEAQRIAVIDGGFHVEIEHDLGAALGLQGRLAAIARLMVERDRVHDTVGLHGGLADDGGNAGHGFVSK
jgi:hypothetical protein